MAESWNDCRVTWELSGKFYILGFGTFCTCKGQAGKDQGNEPGRWSESECQLV